MESSKGKKEIAVTEELRALRNDVAELKALISQLLPKTVQDVKDEVYINDMIRGWLN